MLFSEKAIMLLWISGLSVSPVRIPRFVAMSRPPLCALLSVHGLPTQQLLGRTSLTQAPCGQKDPSWPNHRGLQLAVFSSWASRGSRKVQEWFKNFNCSPGWYGSVHWALACKPKSLWFDSQLWHMPGLQARYPVGGTQEATTYWCFSLCLLSPSPSL